MGVVTAVVTARLEAACAGTTAAGTAAAGTAVGAALRTAVGTAVCLLDRAACCAARRTAAAALAGVVPALSWAAPYWDPTPGAGAGPGPLIARPTRAASEDAAGAGGARGTGPVARDAGSGAVPHPPGGGLPAASDALWLCIAPILGAQKLLVPPRTTKYCALHSQAQESVVVPLLVYTVRQRTRPSREASAPGGREGR